MKKQTLTFTDLGSAVVDMVVVDPEDITTWEVLSVENCPNELKGKNFKESFLNLVEENKRMSYAFVEYVESLPEEYKQKLGEADYPIFELKKEKDEKGDYVFMPVDENIKIELMSKIIKDG